MEQRTVKHAVNRLVLAATCTVRGPSRLPKCLGGGSRTGKDRYGPADSSALLPNAGWRSSPVRTARASGSSNLGKGHSQPTSVGFQVLLPEWLPES